MDPRAGKVMRREFAGQWLEGRAELAPKTTELQEHLLSRVILPGPGDVELADLTPARVRAWRDTLLRAGRPGPTTVAKAYRLLCSMMVTAVVDNLVARNRVPEKGAGVERSPEMRVATPEQVPPSPLHRAALPGAQWQRPERPRRAGGRRRPTL